MDATRQTHGSCMLFDRLQPPTFGIFTGFAQLYRWFTELERCKRIQIADCEKMAACTKLAVRLRGFTQESSANLKDETLNVGSPGLR